jgi:hypothetical protein
MTITFGELLWFTVALLIFALVIIGPFLVYLFHRDRRECESSEKIGASCHTFQREISAANHEFQREVTATNMKAFTSVVDALNKTSEALTRNSEVLRDFESRTRGSVRT